MCEELVRPWPLCLGTFDEESCRYFLHEVGTRIVPSYPFSFGMEEVYGLILEKYGFDNTPDVTSLLQELLEDDYNATGLGDDGDVWRSWRHGWRHRNDDVLNPFIPRYGPLILRTSTTPRVRHLKANNFTLQYESHVEESEAVKERSKDSACQKCQFDSHRKPSKILSRCPGLATDIVSPQAVTSSDTRLYKKQQPKWKRLRSLSAVERSPAIQSGCRMSIAGTEPDLSVLFEEPDLVGRAATQLRGGESAETEASGQANVATTTEVESMNEYARCSFANDSCGCPTRFVGQATERAANREARLIDGTIFTSRGCTNITDRHHQVTVPIFSECAETRPKRVSWSPIRRRNSIRGNWIHEIGRLLHRRQSKQSVVNLKHCSVPATMPVNSFQQLSKMSTASEVVIEPKSAVQVSRSAIKQVGFDGASDQPTCKSPADLNKPLPLNPDEIVRSMSSRSQVTSQYSDTVSNLPSATSTTSSLSRASSKKDFRGLTRELLNCEMLTPHELPPIREVDNSRKDAVDPRKSPAPPASVALGNPYAEKSPRNSTRPPPLDFSKLQYKGQCIDLTQHIPEIQSSHDTIPAEPKQLESRSQPVPQPNPHSQSHQTGDTERHRGRSKPRPTSPIQTHKENLPPKTPTKRSRSPIKRFLGLTKSNSANKLEDVENPAQPTTPASTKKESLKRWGDKFRYGFLTPDQEQLRQEELIEAHNNDSTASTPQNSTFPISLEPPVQAKVQSEVELIMIVTANRYLLREARAGRISAESVAKTKDLWEKMNRPQVVEFHYDQLTQHNLVMANLDRVKLYGDAAKDAIAINSTMRGWKIMAREMSIRTFCCPDSVIRKHLHDAHRVLELLGAPLVTFLAFEDMQLKTLAKISQRQKERMGKRAGSVGRDASSSSIALLAMHRRNASEGSYQHQHDYSDYPVTALQMDKISLSPSPTPLSKNKVRKATGAEGAIMSLPTNFEKSREAYAANLRSIKMNQTVKEI